jgi:hypothetical protein
MLSDVTHLLKQNLLTALKYERGDILGIVAVRQ